MAWSRSRYIPPHRANNGVSAFNGTAPSDGSTQYGFNRSAPRPRGRGGGRFGGRWFCEFPDNRNNVDNLELVSGVENAGGINFDAYESVPVEATGNDIPPPVSSTFAETELEEGLKRNIVRCKYVKPTPIQRHAIPIVIAGRDLMACAQTGSGKTAAFCVPIISGILKGRSPSSMPRGGFVAYPTALILSPTRELSSQIHDEANKFAYQTGLKVVVAYGGAPITQQLRNLEKGVDILVATPGRLVDMIERGRVSLTRIKYLALDEGDRMLDMGFEPQVRQIVEQMQMPPPGVRQTLLFSATFPTDIQKLASDFLSDYIFLAVGRVGSSTELIAQKIEFVEDTDKRNHLMALLRSQMTRGANGKQPLTLVFVETKRGADNLQHWLSRNGFPAMSIHGDKVQMEREHALRSFKSGATPILVATDVASRGLDIPHVAHVINFDLPREIDSYVHRIGRTGRAGKSGLATAFFSDKNIPLAKALVGLLHEAKQDVPSWLSQYVGCSSPSDSNHRAPRYGSGKYGGRDFRNVSKPEVENYNYFSTNGNADYAVQSQSYNNDTSFRNVTKPEVENYNYFSTNGNADYAAESNNTDTSFDIINSNTGSSYDNPNAAFAGSYHYTDANTDLYGGGKVEEDGPCGYESIVATGWD